MKSRLLLFLVFQFFVWGFYFNWEKKDQIKASITLHEVKVVEQDIGDLAVYGSLIHQDYRLILRNDGFFTRINPNQSTESGIWRINYDIPSIILKSPTKEYKYRILDENDDVIRITLMNSYEITEKLSNEDRIQPTFTSTTSIK